MDDVKAAIRQYILTNHLQGESPENLRDDTPLQTSGILDSLAVLGLATFLMQRYGVDLDIYDTSIERFNRIDDMTAMVVRKQAPVGQPPGSTLP